MLASNNRLERASASQGSVVARVAARGRARGRACGAVAPRRPIKEEAPQPLNPRRCPKAEALGDAEELGGVRDSRAATTRDGASGPQLAAPPRGMRATCRGVRPRGGRRSCAAAEALSKPGTACFFADLFSGKGGVAKGLRALGFLAKEYEIVRGVDLLHK